MRLEFLGRFDRITSWTVFERARSAFGQLSARGRVDERLQELVVHVAPGSSRVVKFS